jgi:hypothetical protein
MTEVIPVSLKNMGDPYRGKKVEGTYLFFVIVQYEGKKTFSADVWAKNDRNDHLGTVKWHWPWRQYAFEPEGGTIYEKTCLREIAYFCEELTKKERQGWRRAKEE